MKITLLCTDPDHPVNTYLYAWRGRHRNEHDILILRDSSELEGGDILFLISCSEFIRSSHRGMFRKTLVIHAADLPVGRGWSPHLWQILEGKTELTVTLLEADDKVDRGAIWYKKNIQVPKHALWDEINEILFEAECDLMDFALENMDDVIPCPQDEGIPATYYPKRSPNDSRLDPEKSFSEQFDLLRVSDPNRYPAYFDLNGHTYILRIEKK